MDQLQHYNEVQRKALQMSVRTKAEKLEYVREYLSQRSASYAAYAVVNMQATKKEDLIEYVTAHHGTTQNMIADTNHIVVWHPAIAHSYVPAPESITVVEAKI